MPLLSRGWQRLFTLVLTLAAGAMVTLLSTLTCDAFSRRRKNGVLVENDKGSVKKYLESQSGQRLIST